MSLSTLINGIIDGRRSQGVAEINTQNRGNKLSESVMRELLGDDAFEQSEKPDIDQTPRKRVGEPRKSRTSRALEPDRNVALGEGALLRGLLSAIFRE